MTDTKPKGAASVAYCNDLRLAERAKDLCILYGEHKTVSYPLRKGPAARTTTNITERFMVTPWVTLAVQNTDRYCLVFPEDDMSGVLLTTTSKEASTDHLAGSQILAQFYHWSVDYRTAVPAAGNTVFEGLPLAHNSVSVGVDLMTAERVREITVMIDHMTAALHQQHS